MSIIGYVTIEEYVTILCNVAISTCTYLVHVKDLLPSHPYSNDLPLSNPPPPPILEICLLGHLPMSCLSNRVEEIDTETGGNCEFDM